jgi:ATP-dependent Clp protease ATP-binding subunit ClpA
LKRAIQREIENPLARKLIGGEVHEGQRVYVDNIGGGLVFVTEPVGQALSPVQVL